MALPVMIAAGAAAGSQGAVERRCPSGSIAVNPEASIQRAVDRAREGAVFCLKDGTHRMQVVRPKAGQRFQGEGNTVLNGSRPLTKFVREGPYWVATGQQQRGEKHGRCTGDAPVCDRPEAFFIDDAPLKQVKDKQSVGPGRFYLDHGTGRLYFADNPEGRKVEVTVAAFAFESTAPNVLIRNLTVEKYASVAQKGAIHGWGSGWIVEDCEVRLNSGAGIWIGAGGRVRGCDVHHNGQLGIGGRGSDLLVENNDIRANNTHGFDFEWEAGGLKMARSEHVVLRGNRVRDNVGPGLWCDIECRDVLYENNVVENNADAGIFHEISFRGVIRNNVVRHNGTAGKGWLWGDDILVSASQDVEVYGNSVTVSPGRCGIMLVDQGRNDHGPFYKTRENRVHDNDVTFEGAACAGGASDVKPGHENFSIITDGHNVFDGNRYRVPRAGPPARFAWGHALVDWDGLRALGVEPNGRLEQY
jgi:parallel beta-helix repeat protein